MKTEQRKQIIAEAFKSENTGNEKLTAGEKRIVQALKDGMIITKNGTTYENVDFPIRSVRSLIRKGIAKVGDKIGKFSVGKTNGTSNVEKLELVKDAITEAFESQTVTRISMADVTADVTQLDVDITNKLIEANGKDVTKQSERYSVVHLKDITLEHGGKIHDADFIALKLEGGLISKITIVCLMTSKEFPPRNVKIWQHKLISDEGRLVESTNTDASKRNKMIAETFRSTEPVYTGLERGGYHRSCS